MNESRCLRAASEAIKEWAVKHKKKIEKVAHDFTTSLTCEMKEFRISTDSPFSARKSAPLLVSVPALDTSLNDGEKQRFVGHFEDDVRHGPTLCAAAWWQLTLLVPSAKPFAAATGPRCPEGWCGAQRPTAALQRQRRHINCLHFPAGAAATTTGQNPMNKNYFYFFFFFQGIKIEIYLFKA